MWATVLIVYGIMAILGVAFIVGASKINQEWDEGNE